MGNNAADPEAQYTHTVHCYDDKSLRKHFEGVEAAATYANTLARQRHKVKIFPYTPPRKYIDYLVERGPGR